MLIFLQNLLSNSSLKFCEKLHLEFNSILLNFTCKFTNIFILCFINNELKMTNENKSNESGIFLLTAVELMRLKINDINLSVKNHYVQDSFICDCILVLCMWFINLMKVYTYLEILNILEI